MEENNLNSNNQMNANNSVENQIQQSKGNNKLLVVLMTLIILCLVGYIVYTKFIQKSDTDTSKDNNTQEKDHNNQQTDNTNNGVSKKLISLKGSCNDVSEAYNNINVNLKKIESEYTCQYELKINGKKISTDEALEVESFEFYDNYVIAFTTSDGGSSIYLVDTKNTNYDTYNGIEYHHTEDIVGCPLGWNPNSYTSDDEGILIDGTSIWGQCGIANPGYNYAKIRVKYENGKFGLPEIVEKITNR